MKHFNKIYNPDEKTNINENPPICEGGFMEIVKCEKCGMERDDEEYNYDENMAFDYDYSSYGGLSSSYSSGSSDGLLTKSSLII